MLYAFIVAAVFITLAELGDKTQLLVLALATKYRPWHVLVGVFAATLAIFFAATLVGRLIGNLIPDTWLAVGTGIAFIGFGIWTLRGETDRAEDAEPRSSLGPILAIAGAFFLAELGDKTQIMTMTLAANPAAVLQTFGGAGPAVSSALARIGASPGSLSPSEVFWGVWLGSVVGMMIADGLAILVGALLGRNLPAKGIRIVSGTIFILFGLASLGSLLLR